MTLSKYKSTITLITLFLLIATCTTDNTITGNSDQSLAKPTGVLDVNSPESGDDPNIIIQHLRDIIIDEGPEAFCIAGIDWLLEGEYAQPGTFVDPYSRDNPTGIGINNSIVNSSYDFRDNYLSKSEKGEVYTACYYLLSKYGIENNLVGKYYKEHYDLLKSSIVIAHDLQHGNNNNQILINNDIADKLEEMLKIYKNHNNLLIIGLLSTLPVELLHRYQPVLQSQHNRETERRRHLP